MFIKIVIISYSCIFINIPQNPLKFLNFILLIAHILSTFLRIVLCSIFNVFKMH